MPNRLADQTSPYLLQHADNPVDWWPWSQEAFAEAQRRDVPVLLSVGYAACHWCHVMAHESFEDDETAHLMNEHFVCVKVDREERPDVDQIYMSATQAMTGQGGWPMTAFLTPDGAPFYCGTYFPPEPRHGMPSFPQLLAAVTEAWRDRREAAVGAGQQVVDALSRANRSPESAVPGESQVADMVTRLRAVYDEVNGGFGGAPKFPPAMCLLFLLRHVARHAPAEVDGRVLRMVEDTCERMARGGIYDQLAGGFARYSVDVGWAVPHFEKMLYDNALLLRTYLNLWRETRSPLALRIATETADFIGRDLGTDEGGFASALDADTDGVEGATYVWRPAELVDVLGPEDGRWAAELLSVTEEGTFEHGASVLQLRQDPDDPDRWAEVRGRLLDARRTRPQPDRDDKVVTAWNGLAIGALAEAGAVLGEPSYVELARRCADMLLRTHLVRGRLRRTSRHGRAGESAGVLEDYGDLAEGLLVLHQATGERRLLETAGELLDVVLGHFADGRGGFFDTADDAERLIARPADPTDNATPSGQSAVAGALLTYAALTGSARHREAAEYALRSVSWLGVKEPRFAGWSAAVTEAMLAGPLQVAVVGDGAVGDRLVRTAWQGTSPGAVVVAGGPDEAGVPLLAGRDLMGGEPAAYVCRGFVCDRPTGSPEELASSVGARALPA